MDIHSLLEDAQGFQWDQGNSLKNWLKHRVSEGESEQVFFNEPLLLLTDEKHSQEENRFCLMGRTDQERYLFIVFTVRKNLIRIISARDMHKKERGAYEKLKADS